MVLRTRSFTLKSLVADDDFWDDQREQMYSVLIPLVEDAAVDGVTEQRDWLEAAGVGLDWNLVNTFARQWAQDYTYKLVGGITDTTRKHLQESISKWIDSGAPLKDLIADISGVYPRHRAEMIAITEVTRAFAEGNMTAWRESGVVSAKRWQTAVDERVCPICGGYADKLVDLEGSFVIRIEGEEVITALPPAHVRCRCWLYPSLKRVPMNPNQPKPSPTGEIEPQIPQTGPKRYSGWDDGSIEYDFGGNENYERYFDELQSVHGFSDKKSPYRTPDLKIEGMDKGKLGDTVHGRFDKSDTMPRIYMRDQVPGFDPAFSEEDTWYHEFGHFLDHRSSAGRKVQGRVLDEFGSITADHPIANVVEALYDTTNASALMDIQNGVASVYDFGMTPQYSFYLTDQREVWARAYSQYVAYKKGRFDEGYERLRKFYGEGGVKIAAWTRQEMEEVVVPLIDDALGQLGWLE